MDPSRPFDVTTDFQDDSGGRDPDRYSSLLQEYHLRLWRKRLPDGEFFDLTPDRIGSALVLRYWSGHKHFVLSSDTLANSSRGPRRALYDAMGVESNLHWHRDGGTIGGRLIFPSNRVDGKQTINQLRGTHPRIRDRFDLTLESIRRHYCGESGPLADVLARYGEFFTLFGSFRSYIEVFLLNDLIDGEGGIAFFLPFEDFDGPVLPDTLEEYRLFRQRQLDFVGARNRRMLEYMSQTSHSLDDDGGIT